MKFQCKKCKKEIELHKVKLAFHFGLSELVCKDAFCCNEFMDQIKTKEYEGLPDIKRNEPKHSQPDGDKEWKRLQEHLHGGGLADE